VLKCGLVWTGSG